MALDQVHDIQQAYRKVVEAFSFPGKVISLKEEADQCDYEMQCDTATQVLMYMLLDADTNFHMVSNDPLLSHQFARLTYSNHVSCEEASFIFVTRDRYADLKDVIQQANVGTLLDPHKAATIIVECESIEEHGTWSFTGCGIQDVTKITIDGMKDWYQIRQEKNVEYPLGIDMVLIDRQKNIVALPRTTQIKE